MEYLSHYINIYRFKKKNLFTLFGFSQTWGALWSDVSVKKVGHAILSEMWLIKKMFTMAENEIGTELSYSLSSCLAHNVEALTLGETT